MTVNLDMLAKLEDAELRDLITRCEELLAQHDRQRKDKALEQARALLAAVGLSLKDLNGKPKTKTGKGLSYRTGHTYQHPTNKALTWPGKGKKPGWLVALEADGKTPVDVENG